MFKIIKIVWVSANKICLAMICMVLFHALVGCTNVAMSGAEAVYNQHSLRKSLNDHYLAYKVHKSLEIDTTQFADANISVVAYNQDILLAGQVPQAWQRERAERIVRRLPGVGGIHNDLKVASPSSALTRLSDTWITTKVKAKLTASEDVDVTQVRVLTENGVVYMMGMLQPEAAQAAASLASSTDGVVKVVRLFDYIHITKNSLRG